MLELYLTVHVTLESEFGDLFLHGQLFILNLSLHVCVTKYVTCTQNHFK